MRLVEITLKLESPLIISSKQTKEGYVNPLNYIPGSTLRGSILSALYAEKVVDDETIKREAKDPSILASPAYPIVEGFKCYPATPFVSECKKCGADSGKVYDQTEEAVRAIKEGRDPIFRTKCEDCKNPLSPLYGLLIYERGKKAEIGVFRSTSVGIDKERFVSRKGMLFDYEAIEEGTEFWARLRIPEDFDIRGLEIFIGRGASRGFGQARIKSVTDYEPKPGEILYALSDLVPLKTLKHTFGNAKVKARIREVYGRLKSMQAGWDFIKKNPRPKLKVVRAGAVVVAEIDYYAPEVSAVGIPIYAGEYWITGLNVLMSIDEFLKRC